MNSLGSDFSPEGLEEDATGSVPEPEVDSPPLEVMDPQGTVRVADPAQYAKRWDRFRAEGVTDEYSRSMGRTFQEFESLCSPKPLGLIPHNHEDLLAELTLNLPHLSAFLQQIDGACCRAHLRPGTKDLRAPHFLLAGEPGVAKTHAVELLASTLGLHFSRIAMNGQGAAFELRGLGRMWRSTQPGAIAKGFRDSLVANPVFYLDEIDKGASKSGHYGAAIDVLLDLLERQTARVFTDECLEIQINASHALYVATANDITALPEPLLSRFTVIEVPRPNPAQMRTIVSSIFRHMAAAEEGLYDPELPEQVIAELQNCTPREAKLRLENAMNIAAQRVARRKSKDVAPIQICPGDLPMGYRSTKRSIGFTP